MELDGRADLFHDRSSDDRTHKQREHHQHRGDHGQGAKLCRINSAGAQIRAVTPLDVVNHGGEQEGPDKTRKQGIQNLDAKSGVFFEEKEDIRNLHVVFLVTLNMVFLAEE